MENNGLSRPYSIQFWHTDHHNWFTKQTNKKSSNCTGMLVVWGTTAHLLLHESWTRTSTTKRNLSQSISQPGTHTRQSRDSYEQQQQQQQQQQKGDPFILLQQHWKGKIQGEPCYVHVDFSASHSHSSAHIEDNPGIVMNNSNQKVTLSSYYGNSKRELHWKHATQIFSVPLQPKKKQHERKTTEKSPIYWQTQHHCLKQHDYIGEETWREK